MNMVSGEACLSERRIENCLKPDGFSEPAEQEHLEHCSFCQERLELLTRSEYLNSYRGTRRSDRGAWNFLSSPPRPGDLGAIDEFAIEEAIDSGGMGVVLRGWDTKLSRPVAVKVLSDQHSNDSYARFAAETRAVARLNHPHIVPVFSIGRTVDHRPYMVMPLIEGRTLRNQLTAELLSPSLAAQYIRQVASGLEAAHQAGLIHRDIKPANIIIDRSDGSAKIIDFGLVREQNALPLTRHDVLCGTPEYMSVEQAENSASIDARSDIYSLGITLYECLTGTPPFRGQPLEILEQHRTCEPLPPTQLNRHIPRDLETICLKAIAKDRERRYASARRLLEDIERFQSNRPILARPVSRFEKLSSWCGRNRPLAIASSLLIFVLLGASASSTALWLRSQRAATISAGLAQELTHSRNRLRESVRRFQSRVFSDESLHWQMSKDFRAEMFRDVVEYLDEFSKSPPNGRRAGLRPDDELARSYLEVAQAALHVGEYEESLVAAKRALARVHWPEGVPATAESLMLRSQAARIMLLATLQLPESQEEVAKNYATECLGASSAAVSLSPEDIAAELNHLTCVVAVWGAGYDQNREGEQFARMEKAQQRLAELAEVSYPPVTLEQIRRTLAQLFWLLIPSAPSQRTEQLLGLADANATSFRELLRKIQKPLLDSDRFRGGNQLLRARIHRENNELAKAISAMEAAVIHFKKATELQPLNRVWREELATVQSELSFSHQEIHDYAKAREAINSAIVNFVQILETDPKDFALRMKIIDALNRYGDLSFSLSDHPGAYRGFYTAAQDCRLLTHDQEAMDWAFHSRVRSLVQAYRALDEYDSEADKSRTDEQVRYWLAQIRANSSLDAEQAEKLIESRELPQPIDFPESIQVRLRKRNSHLDAIRVLELGPRSGMLGSNRFSELAVSPATDLSPKRE